MIQQFFRRKFPFGFLIAINLIIILLYIIFIWTCVLHLSNWSPGSRILVLVPYNILFVLLVWSIFESIRTDPGRVPFQWGFAVSTNQRKYCLICHIFKPERTHHCSTCNRCVLNMDHHCPWINRCIGFYNRKAFILMLFYTTVITFFNLIIAILCIQPIVEAAEAHTPSLPIKIIFVILATLLNCIIFIAILNFLRFHINLILENYTTLEILEIRRNQRNQNGCSPYDMGKYYNWVQVFGRNWCSWGIPIFLSDEGPSGDGVLWPRSNIEQSM